MKKNARTLFAQLGENEVTKLATIVDETLAVDFQQASPKRSFTAAELWNIQRRQKSPLQRRFIL